MDTAAPERNMGPEATGAAVPPVVDERGRRQRSRPWPLDAAPETLVLRAGVAIVGTFMALAALDVGGQVILWENAHWTAAGAFAALYATLVARTSAGTDRTIALLVAVGTMAWFAGQCAWVVQTAFGYFQVPAPSDLGFLLVAPPIVVAFVVAVYGRLSKAEEVAVYFDAVAILLTLTAIILAIYGDQMGAGLTIAGTVAIAFPIVHLAAAAAGLVALLAARASPRGGGYIVLIGLAVLGFAWVDWLRQAVVALPAAGSLGGYAFSVGIVAVGLGARSWRLGEGQGLRFRQTSTAVLGGLPLVALFASALMLAIRHVVSTELGPVEVCSFAVILLAGVRQSFLVHEQGRLLDDSRHSRTDLEVALIQRAEADSRYQTLVERVPAAVYIDVADPGVTDGGHLAYMSPQIEAILGYPPEAFLTDPELWPRLTHPDDRATTLAALADHWRTEQPLRLDYRMIASDGSIVWVHDEAYAMRDETTGGRRVSQGLLVDTTEQKRLEAQLLHDAFHDPLTGLANRALFREHLDRALDRSRRRRAGVAVLFLDVDDFKVVNDSLGHAAGDRLLVEVAERLTATIRTDDIAARQGGDEFTILVERVNGEEEAVVLAERLAAAIRRPIVLEGRPLVVGVSIGIALGRGKTSAAGDLLAHADAAMYAAKEQGKGRHVVFDPSMQRRAKSRLETETELRAAIEAEDFEVHYQPIVELPSHEIVGFEALVRWRHATRGLVLPGEFIPLAEATGLIVPLGKLVTETACRQLRAWRDAGIGRPDLTMSVNASARQVIEPGFGAEVRDILLETGLDPSALELEITESLTMRETATGDGALRQLHELGVRLAIDDFGTGFSALEYFKRFAVHGLKIDRSFVGGLGASREDTAIVTATLSFASALGLVVTAEGVEMTHQLERLEALGCHRAQGYLFSPAVPADEVPALFGRSAASPAATDVGDQVA